MLRVGVSGAYRTHFNFGSIPYIFQLTCKVTSTKYIVQLNATMEQTCETQLANLYVVLSLRRVIARYDVLSMLHDTRPCTNYNNAFRKLYSNTLNGEISSCFQHSWCMGINLCLSCSDFTSSSASSDCC